MRSTFSVSAPTLLSRILGYIRDLIQAYYLGTSGTAGAFIIAYTIPNLLRRLTGEGAMTAAFVPVFTQLKKEKTKEELWKFANTFFFDLVLVMTAITLLGIVFSPILVKIIAIGYGGVPGKWSLTILLTRIMFPYMLLISLSALAMAILNSLRKFFVPALTPVLFNLSIISVTLCFAGKMKEPVFAFAGGVLLGGILQLAFQIPFLWKNGMKFDFGISFANPSIRKVVKLMVPGIFGAGVAQINFTLSRMIATLLEEGSVPSLYYASRVQELTLGLFSVALSIALLPTFSKQVVDKDIYGMKETIVFSFKAIFFITIPAMTALLVLNRPIIQILFQHGGEFDELSTTMSASCLFFFAFGLPFISCVKMLAPAFYSFKDIKTPVIVSFFTMIGYIGLSLILMKSLRAGGIALALSIASIFNFLALFILLEKRIGRIRKKTIFATAVKSLFSSAVMGFGVWFFMEQFEFRNVVFLKKFGILCSTIVVGIMIYIICNMIINRRDLKMIKDLFSRKRKNRIKRKR